MRRGITITDLINNKFTTIKWIISRPRLKLFTVKFSKKPIEIFINCKFILIFLWILFVYLFQSVESVQILNRKYLIEETGDEEDLPSNSNTEYDTYNNNSFIYKYENKSSLHESSGDAGAYQMMHISGYVFSAIFLFIIWIVGSIGNFLVMFLVGKNKQLQTPMNMFLVNLSISDLMMAALGSPISFFAAVLGKWPFGHTGCIIYGFGMALGGITSITTLMVLAFERFLMIARPFRAADIQNHHSGVLIIFIWMYSLILTIPPLFGWASYGPEAAYISCSVNWESEGVGTTSYIVFLFAMGLVIPMMTILFSYFGILITIRQTVQSQTISAVRRGELRVVGMIAMMVISFMIAWIPYAIVSLIVAFSSEYRSHITGFVAVLPSIFAKSSCCYNPAIYVGLNTQFKSAWLRLLGREPAAQEDDTAMTLSATGVPKGSRRDEVKNLQNFKVDGKNPEGNAESTFTCKNIRKATSSGLFTGERGVDAEDNQGMTPLLHQRSSHNNINYMENEANNVDTLETFESSDVGDETIV